MKKKLNTQIYKFVFMDFEKDGKSVYNTPEGMALSLGSLHAGSTFTGVLTLSEQEIEDIDTAITHGFHPVFSLQFRFHMTYKKLRMSVLSNKGGVKNAKSKPKNS